MGVLLEIRNCIRNGRSNNMVSDYTEEDKAGVGSIIWTEVHTVAWLGDQLLVQWVPLEYNKFKIVWFGGLDVTGV